MANKYYQELKSILQNLKQYGYECYIYHKEDDYALWGVILTPNNNILYIQRNCLQSMGWDISFEYVKSKKNGDGCICREYAHYVDLECVKKAEKTGLEFAVKLNAELHKDARKALQKKYKFEEMEKV